MRRDIRNKNYRASTSKRLGSLFKLPDGVAMDPPAVAARLSLSATPHTLLIAYNARPLTTHLSPMGRPSSMPAGYSSPNDSDPSPPAAFPSLTSPSPLSRPPMTHITDFAHSLVEGEEEVTLSPLLLHFSTLPLPATRAPVPSINFIPLPPVRSSAGKASSQTKQREQGHSPLVLNFSSPIPTEVSVEKYPLKVSVPSNPHFGNLFPFGAV